MVDEESWIYIACILNVCWTYFYRFKETFCKEYSDQLNAQYGAENIEWLMTVLHREIDEDEDDSIMKFHYEGRYAWK